MTTSPEEATPRRGRPRSRGEIVRDGRIGGLDAEALAGEFGTPFYVYDLDVVTRQVEALRAALPPTFELAYAVKANPALAVVSHFAELGLGADIASGGELETVLRAGIRRAQVVFTGPGKRDEELRRAVRLGIRAITVESPGELERVERLAAEEGRSGVPILLRRAVADGPRLERIRLVGDDGAGKFGMGQADLEGAARAAARSARLDLLGLHAFGASNVLDAAALARHIGRTVTQARDLFAELDRPLRLVDAGGGLGIAYEAHEEGLDLVSLRCRLEVLAESWRRDRRLAEMRVLLEPGRFLTATAGAYVSRVVDVKRVADQLVAILDGGVHHLLRPALVGQEHRLRLLRRGPARGRLVPVTVAGPLCSGLDIFSHGAVLPEPAVGDLVAVLDVGAYGFSESMPLFLSHGTPAEIALRGGEARLIRPRMRPDLFLALQLQPRW